MRRRLAQVAVLVVVALLGAATFALVDLEPRVEGDFFFATDDPQLRENRRIEEQFGSAELLFVQVTTSRWHDRATLVRLRELTEALEGIDGVESARSVTHGPMDADAVDERDPEKIRRKILASPWWRELLIAPDEKATYIVLVVREEDPAPVVQAIDRVVHRFSAPGFEIASSGVAYVSEHVRAELSHDLKVFSLAALVVFTVLVTILFRSVAVTVGTIAAALSACFLTFLVRAFLGMSTGILTPNLWTIAFVLTLSHVVYLTASYRRAAQAGGDEQALGQALRLTGAPALWSLVANLLGFLSLVFVAAKPLREFGISGGIAAICAMACAFLVYPPFLRSMRVLQAKPSRLAGWLEGFFTRFHPILAFAFVLLALALAPFSRSVDTDPALTSYFAGGGEIRQGLEAIDASGGSSPLDIVVRDAHGGSLQGDEPFARLVALQDDLKSHEDVGTVLSIALLMEETDRRWYSFMLSWKKRLKALESPKRERVGDSFVSDDRMLGRFTLRMHEQSRTRPREEVIAELHALVRSHGFEPAMTGGLYRLQGSLSELVRASVVRGLGGLVGLFFVIALITTRSLRTSVAMAACLALVPLALYGFVALLGMPLDIISAPAASVALPLGIDEMIHLGYALRRARGEGTSGRAAWTKALGELWLPTFASMLIIVSGFALMLLSRFPPTHRLGVLACAGGALTDMSVLIVLPVLATLGLRAKR